MKVLVVDDHWVFRAGLKALLEQSNPEIKVIEAGSFAEAEAGAVREGGVDLILLDLVLPDNDPFEGLVRMRRRFPEVPLIVLSVLERRGDVLRAIELGATGYLSKAATDKDILAAMAHVMSGEIYVPQRLLDPRPTSKLDLTLPFRTQEGGKEQLGGLTRRQREVFKLLADGMSNAEIASQLGVSAHTVRIHISAIFKALGVSNRTQAALLAAGHRLETGASSSGSKN